MNATNMDRKEGREADGRCREAEPVGPMARGLAWEPADSSMVAFAELAGFLISSF